MSAIPKSRYLEFFTSNAESLKESMEVIGNIIVVEKVKFPETKTASGIIIGVETSRGQLNSLVADRPTFYRVLHVGAGYFKEAKNEETGEVTFEDVPLNARAGDIVLLASASVKHFSSFPLVGSYESDSIGISRDEDVQIRFKGQEEFERFLVGLDSHAKKQVVQQSSQG